MNGIEDQSREFREKEMTSQTGKSGSLHRESDLNWAWKDGYYLIRWCTAHHAFPLG